MQPLIKKRFQVFPGDLFHFRYKIISCGVGIHILLIIGLDSLSKIIMAYSFPQHMQYPGSFLIREAIGHRPYFGRTVIDNTISGILFVIIKYK